MIVKLNKDVVLGSDTQDGSLTLKNNQGQETAKLTATGASSSWTAVRPSIVRPYRERQIPLPA